MKRAVIPVLLLLLPSYTEAAFIDFEDLTPGTEFSAGETFDSGGITFEVLDTGSPGGVVQVIAGTNGAGLNQVGGTGNALGIGGIGINFILLPPGIQQVSMLVRAGTLGVTVNGLEAPTAANGGVPLDGSTIDGVTLSLHAVAGDSNRGVLSLDGPISSLVIKGNELAIDNVTVIIPEPMTVTLLILAGMSLLSKRCTRRP